MGEIVKFVVTFCALVFVAGVAIQMISNKVEKWQKEEERQKDVPYE